MKPEPQTTEKRQKAEGSGRRPLFALASLAVAAVATLLLVECGAPDQETYPAVWSGAKCIDLDGDGFGVGCLGGMDCDDTSAEVTNGCYYCVDHDPGCPCDVDGERESCGVVTNHAGAQVVCGLGERTCSGGAWGECLVNNSVTLGAPQAPGSHTQALGNAAPCVNNPCSLYCQEFADDATGLPSGTGTQTTDGGIGLTPNTTPPAPAFCFGGAQGTCVHSICSAGSALAASCDVTAPPQGVTITLLSETFANDTAGWGTTNEWEIGQANASHGESYGNPDPSADHTPTSDNRVAGTIIGGNTSTQQHGFDWLTSPKIDASSVTGTLTLSYARYLNMGGGTASLASIQAYDGSSWVTIDSITSSVTDSTWTVVTLDLTPYKNAQLRVRFGYSVPKSSHQKVSGWNLDDITVTTIDAPPLPAVSCVQAVCSALPSCCTSSWTPACVAKVPTLCNLDCANVAGTCALCYHDAADHDGDGYSSATGDCLDCDPTVNPGAFDFPANGKDEDCSGVADDEPSGCDSNLALASSQPLDHAKAIDLCRTTTDAATGKQKTWGVLSAALVQANGTSASHALSYGIMSKFGALNLPFKGTRMAAYSSGTARAPGDAGYVNPNGQVSSFNQGKSCAFPAGFPKNGAGCPSPSASSSYAYDSSGLLLKVRVPTNALSMSYKFNFFSSEYPEWVCTYYNDSFIALLTSGYQPANPASNSGNISFDSNNNPVTVNVSFFTVVGGSKLTGTGLDGQCDGKICGGATDWLQTTAPVVPGETITLQLAIWDTGDHVWDSIALVDDFSWSVSPTTIQTFVPQPTAGAAYVAASFTRDYDVSQACPAATSVSWGLWSWSASTPGDSRIDFAVQTASTSAGLVGAPLLPLLFTNPPGPLALVGTQAKAKASVPDTQGGSALVDTTLSTAAATQFNPYLRVTATLVPSSDGTKTPTLTSWNQQFACVPSE